jgi:chaperone BCS1
MDVWIEFKNASKWQAKALFRNFFPSSDADVGTVDDEPVLEMPVPPSPTNSTLSTLFSDAFSGLSSASGSESPSLSAASLSRPGTDTPATPITPLKDGDDARALLPPAMEEHLVACAQARKPLSAMRLEQLAADFAEAIPDEEFSVAALQGCECSCFCCAPAPHCPFAGARLRHDRRRFVLLFRRFTLLPKRARSALRARVTTRSDYVRAWRPC